MDLGVLYAIFGVVVVVLLGVDLFVVQRDPHAVTMREAGIWSAIWIGCAIVFGFAVVLPFGGGGDATVEYFTGYVIEKSLSVDNVFLFVLIFQGLSVPRTLQHRVLFYGVLGAIVLRTIMIFGGVALVERFEWLIPVFGGFLLYIAYKTWRERSSHGTIEDNRALSVLRRVLPTTPGYHGEQFVVRVGGRLMATPLLVVLLLVEFTDVVFAVDSIPAIFAITRDPFIVLTSNIFAILGLRSLYFLLAGAAEKLRYLKAGLAIILAFVGVKLLTEGVEGVWHPSPLQSLGIITVVLVVTVWLSLRADRRDAHAVPPVSSETG